MRHVSQHLCVLILCCMKSIASKGRPRRFPKGDASPVASPPKAEVESGATMIGKPFGRARRRETSACILMMKLPIPAGMGSFALRVSGTNAPERDTVCNFCPTPDMFLTVFCRRAGV